MSAGKRQINGPLLARLVGSDAYQRPYYLGIGRAVSILIQDGRVAPHTRLPAERALAQALGLSRNTIAAAYTWLSENGFLDRRQGAGSWTTLPEAGAGSSVPFLPRADHIDLGVAAPAAIHGLHEATEHALTRLPAYTDGTGYTLRGLSELRQAIAHRYIERGLPTSPEQIFITNGGQQAITLLLDLLLEPGNTLLLESPTYPHALDSPLGYGARLYSMGVGRDGWEPECVVDALRQGKPHLAYLIPDFHNPTGALMGDELRAQLAAEARRAGTFLIIDESMAELAIDAADYTAPVAAYDTDDRVFTIGSVAKLLWGGLRVGWIRTSPSMVSKLMVARQRLDLTGPVLDQLTVAHLLGDITRIREERSRHLRHSRDTLTAAVRDHLPEWSFTVPNGGLVLWCELPHPVATSLSEAASRYGVHIAPGPVFGATGTLERYVRLAYTQPPEVLSDAVERLAEAYATSMSRPTPSRTELYV